MDSVRFKLVVHQYPGGEGRGLSLFFLKNIVIKGVEEKFVINPQGPRV